jgi:hypothetical protein
MLGYLTNLTGLISCTCAFAAGRQKNIALIYILRVRCDHVVTSRLDDVPSWP